MDTYNSLRKKMVNKEKEIHIVPLEILSSDSISLIENEMIDCKIYKIEFSPSYQEKLDYIEEEDLEIPDDFSIDYNPINFRQYFKVPLNASKGLLEKTYINLMNIEMSNQDFIPISTKDNTNIEKNISSTLIDDKKTSEFSKFPKNLKKKLNSEIANKFRSIVFSKNVQYSVFENYLITIYKSLKEIPNVSLIKKLPNFHIFLDKPKGFSILILEGIYKTLFLDLDETLIHLCKGNEPSEISLQISGKNKKLFQV